MKLRRLLRSLRPRWNVNGVRDDQFCVGTSSLGPESSNTPLAPSGFRSCPSKNRSTYCLGASADNSMTL
jgi:hypothetical protein